MNNVFKLSDRRKKVSRLKAVDIVKPTIDELGLFCIEEVNSNWERMANKNRLNDYFIQCTPLWSDQKANYLSDLNALSIVEQKVKIDFQLASPKFDGPCQGGWFATFKINGLDIKTPFFPSEAYARCFQILLFLKVGREMTTVGIPFK